jgi:UDP-N-acetylmuramate dehydrogenase
LNYFVAENQSLKKYNTLSIASTAERMIFPLNEEGIKDVFNNCDGRKIIIGKGSNILLSRSHYDKEFIFVNMKLMDDIYIAEGEIYAQAGVTLSELSWYALGHNISGFEFLEDIPGTVGGAIIMNAGTYNNTIGELVSKIVYYDIEKKQIISEENQGDFFRIRSSKLSDKKIVVLGAYFKSQHGDYSVSLDKVLATKKDRYTKQPRNFSNAGSVFKRPLVEGELQQVWKLINDSGLRGVRKNDAEISDKHTGFIVNKGNATYEDIIYLVNLCKEKVKKEFNIELELEWKII